MLRGQLLVRGCSLVVCALASFCSFAETEYYTWVDENGITNYAQRKPVGYSAQFINNNKQQFGYAKTTREKPSQPTKRPVPTSNTIPAEKDKIAKEIEAEQKRIAANVAATKQSNCKIGKQNLAQLEAFRRIRVRDADGKERVLSEEEKAQRISQAKATVRENCSS